MKAISTLIIFLAFSLSIVAQEKMHLHKSDNVTLSALVNETDSIYFSPDGANAYFRISNI